MKPTEHFFDGQSVTFVGHDQAIREAREAAGLSQGALASRLGVRDMTVYRWEQGLRRPQNETLFGIGEAIGRSVVITEDGVAFVTPDAVQLPPEAD